MLARNRSLSLGAADGHPPLSQEKSKSRRRAPARASVHVLAALDALQREGDHHAHLDLLVGVPLAPRHQQRVEVRREVAVEHLALAHGSCVSCGSCGATRRGATKCGGGLTSLGVSWRWRELLGGRCGGGAARRGGGGGGAARRGPGLLAPRSVLAGAPRRRGCVAPRTAKVAIVLERL